jgi:hypothetical protein
MCAWLDARKRRCSTDTILDRTTGGTATVSTRSTVPRAARWRQSARSSRRRERSARHPGRLPELAAKPQAPLEKEQLIHTSPVSADDRAVTLTDRGRDLLKANRHERHDRTHEPRQTIHAGFSKPRELTTTPRSIVRISACAIKAVESGGARQCDSTARSARSLAEFWRHFGDGGLRRKGQWLERLNWR